MNSESGKFFFVSDLHGRKTRYDALFEEIKRQKPKAVFIGGDIFPSGLKALDPRYADSHFIKDYMEPGFRDVFIANGADSPEIFLIPGNDDAACEVELLKDGEDEGLWKNIHNKKSYLNTYTIFGYACVPPTPFLLKDWERYDVSRYVDPGCIHPSEGFRTTDIDKYILEYGTIAGDINTLTENADMTRSIFLFHSPPYNTMLDRAALDGKKIEHVPLDVHIGSIAIRRFIEEKSPLITLHGHVHESASITGSWQQQIGETYCFSAAHNGKELAIVEFSPDMPGRANRVLI